MSLENKALVRRFYEEIDKGNVEATLNLPPFCKVVGAETAKA
jgi:hypothetical protein